MIHSAGLRICKNNSLKNNDIFVIGRGYCLAHRWAQSPRPFNKQSTKREWCYAELDCSLCSSFGHPELDCSLCLSFGHPELDSGSPKRPPLALPVNSKFKKKILNRAALVQNDKSGAFCTINRTPTDVCMQRCFFYNLGKEKENGSYSTKYYV